MNEQLSFSERAQALLREIGPERVQTYLEARLAEGTRLATRPDLINAYARLAGAKSASLLEHVLRDKTETAEAKVAALDGYRWIVARAQVLGERAETPEEDLALQARLQPLVMDALKHKDQQVQDAAALALTRTKVMEAAGELANLLNQGMLGALGREEVERFVQERLGEAWRKIYRDPRSILVGRQGELEQLFKWLRPGSSVRVVCLTGAPGMGKTMLAREYASSSPHKHILWVFCRHGRSYSEIVDAILIEARKHTGHPPDSSWPTPDMRSQSGFASELAVLTNSETALLVLDDLEIVPPLALTDLVTGLIERLPKLQCLLVGRRVPDIQGAQWLELGPLTGAQINDWLARRMAEKGHYLSPDLRTQIAALSHGSPLMISFLTEQAERSGRIETESAPLHSVGDMLLGTLDRDARRFLEVLAQIDDNFIDVQSGPVSQLLRDEGFRSVDRLLGAMVQSRLLDRLDDGRVRFSHLLIRDLVREQADSRTVTRVNKMLSQIYAEQGDSVSAIRHLLRTGELQAAQRIVEENPDLTKPSEAAQQILDVLINLPRTVTYHPNEWMIIWFWIGRLALSLGEYANAKTGFNSARVLSHQVGTLHEEAQALLGSAQAEEGLGDFGAAMNLYFRALSLQEQLDEPQNSAQTLMGIARLARNQGDAKTATQHARRALTIYEQLKDADAAAEVRAFLNGLP